tara:strand:+ start:849 stop:1448 length:600 start_codon:yes stop_codon:yes gene_type:complete
MSAKIKLNAGSGGGSFSLQAPSSSSNNRVFTLPDSADATLLTSTTATGKILQVVSTTKTDTASSSSSSFADISGMAVTITPSATSSKIYLTGYVHLGINDARYSIYLKFTGGNTASYIGDAATGVECANHVRMSNANSSYEQESSPLMYLDSPNTTSAITYQLQWAIQSGQTAYLNRAYTLDADRGNTASTLTAMEVAA